MIQIAQFQRISGDGRRGLVHTMQEVDDGFYQAQYEIDHRRRGGRRAGADALCVGPDFDSRQVEAKGEAQPTSDRSIALREG